MSFKWTRRVLFNITQDAYSYRNYIYFPSYNSSYSQLIDKNATKSGFFYYSAVAREYGRFIHLKQVYCTSEKAISKDGIVYKFLTMIYTKQLPTACAYDHIVFLYSPWGNIFAHWLQDCLPVLFLVPQEILNKSKIMVSFKNYRPWFDLFNISDSQVIYDLDHFYFAENLYFYNSVDSINGLCIHSFNKLVSFLKDKFELNKIKATRYVFSNKEKNEMRSIANLNEFYEKAQEVFPQYKWDWDKWDHNDLKGLAQTVASIKILVSPSGSKLYNSIYMNFNYTTGICIINSNKIDSPNYAMGLSLGIWQIGYTHKYEHYAKWWNCSIPYGLICLKRLLYVVDHGKWPNDTFDQMKEVFNLTKLFKDSYAHLDNALQM